MSFSELLCWLLLIEPPENTRFERVSEFSWRSGLPWLGPWWGALFLVVIGAAVVFLYLRERINLNQGKRLVAIGAMALFRTLALLLLFALLFRPMLVAEFSGERPRSIAVLIDHTQSMEQADKRLSDDDKKRVAYAKGLVPMDSPLDAVELPTETPVDPDRASVVQAVFENPQLKLLENLRKLRPGAHLHDRRNQAAHCGRHQQRRQV